MKTLKSKKDRTSCYQNLNMNFVLKSIATNEKKILSFVIHDQQVARTSKNGNLCVVALSWYFLSI